MSKDHDYIKELFDNDGIKAPESLSEENMLAMLNAAEEKQFEPVRARKRPSLKKWVAVAAVAVIAVFGITGLRDILTAPPDTALAGDELYVFKSESEIRRLLKSMDNSSGFGRFRSGLGSAEDELVEYESAPLGDSASDTGSVSNSATAKSTGADSHSETYLQVDDVDEADIVKTDGKYIYYVTDSREVVILSAEDGKTKKLSTIGSSGVENYINDIYVKGDRLITVGTIYKDDGDESSSGIVVYDISDRSKPEVLYDFSQTGSILSSRMVGDYVYLITNDYIYRGGRAVPACGSISNPKSLEAADICCVPQPHTTSYIVLSAIDVSSGTQGRSATKAVFGASDQIYCNDHNLYTAAYEWDGDKQTAYTRIVRASLDGLKIKFNGTARVRGHIDDQFSMDEKDGYFRIATTAQRDGMDVNNLFVLDSSLKEVGKVTGFARNESIKSVRYFGDKAYVITYKAIDPLFVIDLSDPARPVIEGEVKIDGFSTLLVPIGEGRLLGIGHATGDNGYGGEYAAGLKLALFDISNPSEPKVLDSKEFKDMDSPAQGTHKALTVNSKEGWFAVPYSIWHPQYSIEDEPALIEEDSLVEDAEAPAADDTGEDVLTEPDDYGYESGVLVFGADNDLHIYDQHKIGSTQLFRSVYIGDYIYALDAEGCAGSFRFSK